VEAKATKPVTNIADVTYRDFGNGEKFAARTARIGPLIGSAGIGCTVTVVPPGKRAFPFHVHHANHELFVILEGTGEYRFGEQNYPIKAGDVCAAPAGGPESAHQIHNTGDGDLMSLSTMLGPEVVEYPDSGKFAVWSRYDWTNPAAGGIRYVGRAEGSLDYWDGE
jgi:uncharacterized cupin superfamily protein